MDPSQIPVVPPPPGAVSNFVDPPTLMPAVITGTVIIQCTVLPFLLARIFVNGISRTFRTEDLFCYIAYAALLAQASLVVYASAIGCARHAWDVPLSLIPPINRYYNYILCCWTISGYFARTFIFLQFKKIFTTKSKGRVYWVIVLSLIANTILYSAFLFAYIFSCWPREKIWNPMIAGRCVNTAKLQMATGILNIVSDVEAFCVPLWAVWQLQMQLKHKVQVFAVFSVGLVAVAIACAGLYFRIHVNRVPDFTWVLTQTAMVCMAELGSIIIVGCAPYLPRLWRWQHLRGKSTYGYGRSTGYSDKHSGNQSSSRSKPKSELDPFASTSDEHPLTPLSDTHIEVHHYGKNGTCEGEQEAAYDGDGIMRTTELSQSTSVDSAPAQKMTPREF